MTPKQFYKSQPKALIEEVCKQADTSFSNFKQIAIASGSVGRALAEKLAEASNQQMTELEILYPERYEKNDGEAA